MNLEILVLVKSVENTYSHPIFARTSYQAEKIVENANFKKTNTAAEEGSFVVDLDATGEYELN